MTPDPDRLLWRRRSFLGWTAALGAALLTRPALAVPDLMLKSIILGPTIGEPYAVFTTEGGEILRAPVFSNNGMRGWRVDEPQLLGKSFSEVAIHGLPNRGPRSVVYLNRPGMRFR